MRIAPLVEPSSPAAGGKCGYAGHIEDGEYKEGEGAQGGEDGPQSGGKIRIGGGSGQNGQGADYGFLGSDAGDQGGGSSPVREAQWLEDGADQGAQLC